MRKLPRLLPTNLQMLALIEFFAKPKAQSYQQCMLSGIWLGVAISAIATLLALISFGFSQLVSDRVAASTEAVTLSLVDIAGYILAAPVIETLLLTACLGAIERLGRSVQIACIVMAALAATLHSLMDPLRFLPMFSSFYLFSLNYFTWRNGLKYGGFLAALVPHIVLNAVAMTLVTFS